jgi:ribosomal protein S18 acetylase RimI-like enzyme
MTATIRKVTRDDKDAITAVARSTESFRENEIECCLDMVDDAIDPGYLPNIFMCYEEDGEVVGFVSYGEDEMTQGTWEVYWVATRKDRQGKGIGKALMEHAETEARRAGARQLVLETSSQDSYAHIRRFYEKLGYAKVATVPDYFASGDHKEIYVKRL